MHYNDIVTLSLWDRMRIQLLEAGEALVLAVVPRGSRRRRLLTRSERELTLGHGGTERIVSYGTPLEPRGCSDVRKETHVGPAYSS
jgi:hypothetical protein